MRLRVTCQLLVNDQWTNKREVGGSLERGYLLTRSVTINMQEYNASGAVEGGQVTSKVML